jgi:hypothetical protein
VCSRIESRATSLRRLYLALHLAVILLIEDALEGSCRILLHVGQHVVIYVRGNRDGRMTEHLAHHLGLHLASKEQRRCCVPQVMEARAVGLPTRYRAQTWWFPSPGWSGW